MRSSGVSPSIAAGTSGLGGAGGSGGPAATSGRAAGDGAGAAGGGGALFASSPRFGRRRRISGEGSMTCRSASTAFQSKGIPGFCSSRWRIKPGSSASRPTLVPEGVRKA